MELFQSLLSNLWSLLMIVLFFGGSIFVHELGHFWAARRRGVHVERFSIGFGPKIFSWKGKDGVEYRLSWLPLGGYVSLPQLSDMRGIEGETATDISPLPQPSYATKMIVFVAGAVCNVLFALVLATIIWIVGQPTTTLNETTRIGYVAPTIELPDKTTTVSPAAEAGLRAGDTIRAVDGRSVSSWMDFVQTLAIGSGRAADNRRQAILSVERDGRTLDVTVHPQLVGDDEFRMIGIEPADDLALEKILPDSAAAAAGLQPGDRLVSADGTALFRRNELIAILQKNAERPTQLVVERAGQTIPLTLQGRLDTSTPDAKPVYRIGVQYRDIFIVVYPTPFKQLAEHTTSTFRVLGGLLSPKSDLGPSKLSGPVGIARGMHAFAQTDIRLVLWFTILVNVNLAIFNLLPIPVLDGGHMAFATIARLRGKALPVSVIGATQSVFIVLLFSMIIYVSYFDSRRWIRDAQNDRAGAAAPATPTPTPAPGR